MVPVNVKKSLEQAVTDRFFQRLAECEDFPHDVLERLKKLQASGNLRNADEIGKALQEGMKDNG